MNVAPSKCLIKRCTNPFDDMAVKVAASAYALSQLLSVSGYICGTHVKQYFGYLSGFSIKEIEISRENGETKLTAVLEKP